MGAEKGKKDGEEKMDVDTEKKEEKKEVDEDKKEVEEKKKEPEPNFEMLSNPARVMKAQMKDLSIGGIVMLNRTDKGDKEEEIVEPMEVNKASTGSEEEGDEPAPPEPFEWREDED